MLMYTARTSGSSALRSVALASQHSAARQARSVAQIQQRRAYAAEAAPTSSPVADAAAPSSSKSASPKLTKIVDQIEQLTLLEAAELVTALKERLNIQEIAMPSAAPAAAPVAAAASADADAAEEKPKEKTVFTLTLKGLKDPTSKAKVIKEIKALNSTMNLVEAKKFVESAPQVLKEGLTKDEAEKLQKVIETAGGVVERD